MNPLTKFGVALAALLAALSILGCSDGGGGGEPDGGPDGGTDTGTEIDPDGGADGGADDGIHIPGLDGAVTVTADAEGVKHLLCETDRDCIAAYAYVSARDLFLVMELLRHSSAGTYSELVCYPDAIEFDFYQRQFLSTPDGESLVDAVFAKLSDDSRELLQAYADGVNAWIDDLRAGRNGARLSASFEAAFPGIADRLTPWTPQDVVAIALAGEMGETGGQIDNDVSSADTLAAVGEELYRDLVLPRPVSNTSIVPEGGRGAAVPRSREFRGSSGEAQLAALREVRERTLARSQLVASYLRTFRAQEAVRAEVPLPHASNNWAVGGALTANGGAIVESDPHGPLQFPTHMYPAEIDSVSEGTGTLHLFGVGLGGPFFLIGRNENVAWGLTTSVADQTDYYEETLVDAGAAVEFDGEAVPLVEKEITIACQGSSPITRTLRWVPHHGPLLATSDDGTMGYSARWVGQDANADIDAWMAIMRASSAEEALAAARTMETRGNNFVAGDAEGHVGWRPLIKVPNRPWAAEHPPYLPLPGDGSAEWQGYLPAEDVPELYDPPRGFVATANNDFTGAWFDGDPTNDATPYMQSWVASDSRAARIEEVLGAAATQDAASSLALQGDSRLWVGERITPPLLDLVQDATGLSAGASAVRDALAQWGYTCPSGVNGIDPAGPLSEDEGVLAESRGCSAYHAFAAATANRIIGDECASIGVGCTSPNPNESLLFDILTRPEVMALGEALWDDVSTAEVETPEQIAAAALEEAAETLAGFAGDDPADWIWAHVTTFVLPSMMDASTHGPYAISGGYLSVAPILLSETASGYHHSYGAMLRMVTDFDAATAVDYWQIPGGIEHHADSPYYEHLIERYAAFDPFIPPFGPEAVANAATYSFEILP